MNRREFMACAVALASQASVASMHMHEMSPVQKKYLAAAPNYNDWQGSLFNQQQKDSIRVIAELIIPVTDTPGAIDAGVPQFIERMAEEWFTQAEQQKFITGLSNLNTLAQVEFQQDFNQLDGTSQIQLLEILEENASEHAWYQYGNVFSDFISDAPFICHIKELTLWGFFTSEVGSTQVLRASVMTTEFKGDIPLSPEQSSWNYLQF